MSTEALTFMSSMNVCHMLCFPDTHAALTEWIVLSIKQQKTISPNWIQKKCTPLLFRKKIGKKKTTKSMSLRVLNVVECLQRSLLENNPPAHRLELRSCLISQLHSDAQYIWKDQTAEEQNPWPDLRVDYWHPPAPTLLPGKGQPSESWLQMLPGEIWALGNKAQSPSLESHPRPLFFQIVYKRQSSVPLLLPFNSF